MQPLEGTDPSIRLEGPESLQAPHRITERLEEYVRWLQQQNQSPSRARPTEASKRELPGSPLGGLVKPTERPPITKSTNPKELRSNRSFSQATSFGESGQIEMVATPKPMIQFVTKSEETRNFRTDQSHATTEGRFAPAPKMNAPAFQPEADLQRVLHKLETANVQPQDLANISNPQPRSADSNGEQNEVADSADKQAHTTENSFPLRKVHPAEFVQPYPQYGLNQPANLQSRSEQPFEGLTRSEIIQTISSAIASVLTEKAEPIIEEKIRQHLKELKLELVTDHEPVFESTINDSNAGYSDSRPVQDIANEVASPDQKSFAQAREVPANIAAWDVSEFRWPLISSHMIKIGAEAIGALSSTVLKTLAETRRRVAVTSPGRRAGTTSIAISLARWVANEGGRVLLVDADLAHPELSSLVGLGPGISWFHAMGTREKGLPNAADYIIRSQQSPICVMPLFSQPVETRKSGKCYDQLGHLLDPVCLDFDLILLDMGPTSQILSELSCGHLLIDTALIVHQDKDFLVTQAQNQLRSLDVEQFMFAQNSVHQPKTNVA
jgi:Mrp family chromosome partitioning ATPase